MTGCSKPIVIGQCAGLGDAGYFQRWTAELVNTSRFHTIPLVVNQRFAQIAWHDAGQHVRVYNRAGKHQTSGDLEKVMADWHPGMMLPRMHDDYELHPERSPHAWYVLERQTPPRSARCYSHTNRSCSIYALAKMPARAAGPSFAGPHMLAWSCTAVLVSALVAFSLGHLLRVQLWTTLIFLFAALLAVAWVARTLLAWSVARCNLLVLGTVLVLASHVAFATGWKWQCHPLHGQRWN